MKTWILIMLFYTAEGAGLATAEFSSLEACQKAGAIAKKTFADHYYGKSVNSICTEK